MAAPAVIAATVTAPAFPSPAEDSSPVMVVIVVSVVGLLLVAVGVVAYFVWRSNEALAAASSTTNKKALSPIEVQGDEDEVAGTVQLHIEAVQRSQVESQEVLDAKDWTADTVQLELEPMDQELAADRPVVVERQQTTPNQPFSQGSPTSQLSLRSHVVGPPVWR